MPDFIGRYEVLADLGLGGMAVVYHARDPRFKREVAVKVLPGDLLADPRFRARFEREAQIIAALEHPGIVPVYDFGEQDRQLYLVMRYMPGGSFADRLRGGPLSLDETLGVLKQLAPALDYAHAQGVIHRDLKPGNILIDQIGNPYLSDFGIAKLAEATTALTGGGAIGTPAYMSPEQVHGDREIDGRSDVYSLGVIVFQMLSGRTPFLADTPPKMMMQHLLDPVPSILSLRPDLPPGVEDAIFRAMAKDRDERFDSAAQMVGALERAAQGERIAEPVVRTSPAQAATVIEAPPLEILAPAQPVITAPQVKTPPAPVPAPRPAAPTAQRKRRSGSWVWTVLGIGVVALLISGLILPTLRDRAASSPLSAGQRIAFALVQDGNTEIYLMDGSDLAQLTEDSSSDVQPAWSPDGSRIAFTSFRDDNADIYVMNADGSNVVQLTDNPLSDSGPAWSPDGTRIAFISYQLGDNNPAVYVMNADGSNATRLTDHATWNQGPTWSPDGSRIAFHSTRDGNVSIYVMSADGSNFMRLTDDPGTEEWPAWSPDGSRIAFTSSRNGNDDIYVMNADGSNVVQLTDNPSGDSDPAWSPDGTQIAFESTRNALFFGLFGATRDIYVMNADGSNVARLTNSTSDGFHPAWQPEPIQADQLVGPTPTPMMEIATLEVVDSVPTPTSARAADGGFNPVGVVDFPVKWQFGEVFAVQSLEWFLEQEAITICLSGAPLVDNWWDYRLSFAHFLPANFYDPPTTYAFALWDSPASRPGCFTSDNPGPYLIGISMYEGQSTDPLPVTGIAEGAVGVTDTSITVSFVP